jgi:hypothetical protein
MDVEKAALVILVTLLLVVLFNLGIFSMAKKRGGEISIFSRVYRRARDPWKEDREKLESLSDQVAQLKKKPGENNDVEN